MNCIGVTVRVMCDERNSQRATHNYDEFRRQSMPPPSPPLALPDHRTRRSATPTDIGKLQLRLCLR